MTAPSGAVVKRPTIRIEGQEYAEARELLVGMDMLESEGGLSRLQLRFTNHMSRQTAAPKLAFEDNQILKLGAAISVFAGAVREPWEVFRGLITGLEGRFGDGPPELVVLAEDDFQRARLQRRTKTYPQLTIKELAESVASVCGLTAVVDGFTTQIGPQVQLNESDLAFLRRMLLRYDGDLQVVGTEMHVSSRGSVQRGTVDLAMHDALSRVRVVADLADQVNEVTVTGWDAAKGKRIRVTSKGASAGPGRGSTGAQLLEQSPLGLRKHHIGHLTVRDEAEGKATADAVFDTRARRFVSLEGTSVGMPEIRVGTHVKITGLGDRFDNTYYVTEARHRYGAPTPGYLTDFRAECAFWMV